MDAAPAFGWLQGALGAIASGALMTLTLIAVTTVLGTLISIAAAAGQRSGVRWLGGGGHRLCRADPQHARSWCSSSSSTSACRRSASASIR